MTEQERTRLRSNLMSLESAEQGELLLEFLESGVDYFSLRIDRNDGTWAAMTDCVEFDSVIRPIADAIRAYVAARLAEARSGVEG